MYIFKDLKLTECASGSVWGIESFCEDEDGIIIKALIDGHSKTFPAFEDTFKLTHGESEKGLIGRVTEVNVVPMLVRVRISFPPHTPLRQIPD